MRTNTLWMLFLKDLNDEDKERVGNILNIIGYDRATEEPRRISEQALGENQRERNGGQTQSVRRGREGDGRGLTHEETSSLPIITTRCINMRPII